MNDTTFMVGIIVFYTFLAFFLANYGFYQYTMDMGTEDIPQLPENPSFWDYTKLPFKYVGFFSRVIFYTISGIPTWINVIVFTPITLTALWLIIRLIRGN